MGFEVWIAIVLLASALSGWIGYAFARKDAPKQAEIDAMAAELEQAREQAESVQDNVSEHFEQSAMLFGKLAADYREFLDHFSASAQNLGLSEARARELIEQGFQPLLTHEEADVVVESASETLEENPVGEDSATSEDAGEDQVQTRAGEVTVEMPVQAGETIEPDEQNASDKSSVQAASSDETPAGGTEEDQARQRA